MRKSGAAVGSAGFLLLAPGIVAGVLPWCLSGWRVRGAFTHGLALRVIGVVMIVAGGAVLIHAFARFVTEGAGTPAPIAPPERLVVGGLYRYVRNPMYLAVLAVIVGQALLFGQVAMVLYAAAVGVAFVAFVHWYEEPTLTGRFGVEYVVYCREVPGWWPRLRPWRGAGR